MSKNFWGRVAGAALGFLAGAGLASVVGVAERSDGRVVYTEHDLEADRTTLTVRLADGRTETAVVGSRRAFDRWMAQPGNRVLVSRRHRLGQDPSKWEVE